MDVSRGAVAFATAAADQPDSYLLPSRPMRASSHVAFDDAAGLSVFGEHGFCVPLGASDDTRRVLVAGDLSSDHFTNP